MILFHAVNLILLEKYKKTQFSFIFVIKSFKMVGGKFEIMGGKFED